MDSILYGTNCNLDTYTRHGGGLRAAYRPQCADHVRGPVDQLEAHTLRHLDRAAQLTL